LFATRTSYNSTQQQQQQQPPPGEPGRLDKTFLSRLRYYYYYFVSSSFVPFPRPRRTNNYTALHGILPPRTPSMINVYTAPPGKLFTAADNSVAVEHDRFLCTNRFGSVARDRSGSREQRALFVYTLLPTISTLCLCVCVCGSTETSSSRFRFRSDHLATTINSIRSGIELGVRNSPVNGYLAETVFRISGTRACDDCKTTVAQTNLKIRI